MEVRVELSEDLQKSLAGYFAAQMVISSALAGTLAAQGLLDPRLLADGLESQADGEESPSAASYLRTFVKVLRTIPGGPLTVIEGGKQDTPPEPS